MASLDTLTQPTTMQDNMAKSRRIHQHLTSRRNRWKPSELELAVMKLHFQKNQYPSKEDKEVIINIMRHKFESKIDLNQLSRWFQHEREKILRHQARGGLKSTYKKFSKDELVYLQTCFEKNNYPRIEEMTDMSKYLNVSLSKIENWYKHNRRALAKKGAFTLKTKKYFKKDELSYLVEMFETHPRPTKEQVTEIAEKLNCDQSQIKNWYANKRKKMKIMAKRQDNESTEASLHKISPSTYAKPSLYPEIDPILGRPVDLNANLSSFISQPNQPKPILSPPRQLHMSLGGILGPAVPNTLSNGTMPVLFVPANMNNASPMIINPSLINNPNQPISIQRNNLSFQEGLKPFDSLQEGAKFPILTPIHQNFPQNIPLIPISGPNFNSGNPSQSLQEFKTPENFPIQQNILPFQMTALPKNGLTPIGPLTPLIPLVKNGEPIPIMSPAGGIPLGGNDKSIPPGSAVSVPSGPGMSRSPIQIQYMTSLYLPYSQNTYYNNYCPIVYQPNSEIIVQGSQIAHPQMSPMNALQPNGAPLNLVPNINIQQFGNAGPQMNRLKPMN